MVSDGSSVKCIQYFLIKRAADDHVDPDDTQADDPDLTYVPVEDDTTLVPDTLGSCHFFINIRC